MSVELARRVLEAPNFALIRNTADRFLQALGASIRPLPTSGGRTESGNRIFDIRLRGGGSVSITEEGVLEEGIPKLALIFVQEGGMVTGESWWRFHTHLVETRDRVLPASVESEIIPPRREDTTPKNRIYSSGIKEARSQAISLRAIKVTFYQPGRTVY